MSNQTFLPEDYLAKKAERRANIFCIILFVVVMLGVVGAFLFTNRQLSNVKARQQAINVQYQHAAMQIQELEELEEQKGEMLKKAELAAALVERVPRSILMAELINRMPPRLGLLELHMDSEKIRQPTTPTPDRNATGSLNKKKRGKTKAEAAEEARKIEAPRYQVTLEMVGVAPTDLEVSKYLAELNSYPLLRDVTLKYSEEKEIEGRRMREFRIRMRLDSEADVRDVGTTTTRQVRNPMDDTVEFRPQNAITVVPDGRDGGN